jgi:hypothetical protein
MILGLAWPACPSFWCSWSSLLSWSLFPSNFGLLSLNTSNLGNTSKVLQICTAVSQNSSTISKHNIDIYIYNTIQYRKCDTWLSFAHHTRKCCLSESGEGVHVQSGVQSPVQVSHSKYILPTHHAQTLSVCTRQICNVSSRWVCLLAMPSINNSLLQ